MEEKITEALGEKSKEIFSKVNQKIQKELKRGTEDLIKELPSLNRCTICTMQLPCSHSPKANTLNWTAGYIPPVKTNYWKIQSRELSLPTTDLKVLEKIEDFREKQIKFDTEEIKKLQNIEKNEQINRKISEAKRINHANNQKIKLEKYKEDIKERKKIMLIQMKENSERQRREEAKFKQYLDLQKKKLIVKVEKNKCAENFYKIPQNEESKNSLFNS